MDISRTGITCDRCGKFLGHRLEKRIILLGLIKWKDICEKCYPLLSEADKKI